MYEKIIVPIFIALVCIGTLGLACWLLIDSIGFWLVAVRTVGRVARIHSQWEDIKRSNDSSSWTQRALVHYPVIAFMDTADVVQEVRANVGSICVHSFHVGQEIRILYIRGNPQSMRINTLTSLYWNAFCLFFIGGCGLIILVAWLCYV